MTSPDLPRHPRDDPSSPAVAPALPPPVLHGGRGQERSWHGLLLAALLLVLLVLVVLGPLAWAQTAGPLSPDTLSSRTAEARRYLDLFQVRSTIASNIRQASEALPAHQRGAFARMVTENMDWADLERAILGILVTGFTTGELAAMADFYGSDTGRSIMTKMPQLLAQMQPAIDRSIERAILHALHQMGI